MPLERECLCMFYWHSWSCTSAHTHTFKAVYCLFSGGPTTSSAENTHWEWDCMTRYYVSIMKWSASHRLARTYSVDHTLRNSMEKSHQWGDRWFQTLQDYMMWILCTHSVLLLCVSHWLLILKDLFHWQIWVSDIVVPFPNLKSKWWTEL